MGWILLVAIIAWFVIDIRRDAKKAREREAMEAAKNEESWYLNAYLERKQREKEDRKIDLRLNKERIEKERTFQKNNNIKYAHLKSDEIIQKEIDDFDRFMWSLCKKTK